MRTVIFAVVTIHLATVAAHTSTHIGADVWLPPLAIASVAVVMIISPLAGLWLIASQRHLTGAVVITLCMGGALLLAVPNHFIWHGPYHVDAISSGMWRTPFRSTAWAIAMTGAAGFLIGARDIWVSLVPSSGQGAT